MTSFEFLVEIDNNYCLKSFKSRNIVERFINKPTVQCGLFIISDDCTRLYTVLGDKIKIPENSIILNIINFWIVYTIDDYMYISYLDVKGMGFELRSYLLIDDYGLLSPKGCTVLINGEWKTYKYEFEFIEDIREVNFDNMNLNLQDLIKSGFSLTYIKYLKETDKINLNSQELNDLNHLSVLNDFNKSLYSELKSLNSLTKKYSKEEIVSVMNYPEYLINIFIEYSKFIG